MTRTTQPGRPEGDPVAPESAGRTTLDRIFDPRSVVVVGASTDPAKRGFQILRALAASGYDGNVLPVNPKGGTILDFEVHPSIAELPHGADLAVFCTPARAAPDLLRECGRKGIAGAVVLAVGFGESGEEGRRLQEALLEAGRESGVRIVGPNTSGLLNMQRGVNLVGARGVRAGSIALLVQSGNIALSMMNEVTERSWGGLSISLGVGNAIDLGFAEALDYLEGHHETSAIIAYLEGVNDPRAFLTSAARVSRTKPIVVIKSGRTTAGATAALSHTGALAGPYDRLRAGLRQAGVVEVTRTDELLHVAETLGGQPPCPEGRGIAILSDGGGQSTLAVDTLTESDTLLSQLSESTSSALRELLGPAAAVRNPVDLAGAADGDPEMFGRAMEVLAADPSVGAVLVIGLFGGYGIRFSETLTPGEVRGAERMVEACRGAGVGLVVHSMYASHRAEPLAVLGGARVPVVGSLEVACRCVAELQNRGRLLASPSWSPTTEPDIERAGSLQAVFDRARSDDRRTLSEPEARAVLEDAGCAFAPAVVARTADGAVAALERFGGPVAMKLVSSTITHKSDVGGVALGVDDTAAAREAFTRIAGLTAEGEGVLVTPMLESPRLELLIGACRDPVLGPVLTVGAGGIWVEALADASHRLLPVSDEDVTHAIAELRIAGLLAAGRGRPRVALDPIVEVVRAVARCIETWPDIAEIEINPLFVYDERALPVDARIVLGHETTQSE